MKACMGGWCNSRDQCPHYSDGTGNPVERLCIRGRDGIRLIEAAAFRTVLVDVFTGVKVEKDETEHESAIN